MILQKTILRDLDDCLISIWLQGDQPIEIVQKEIFTKRMTRLYPNETAIFTPSDDDIDYHWILIRKLKDDGYVTYPENDQGFKGNPKITIEGLQFIAKAGNVRQKPYQYQIKKEQLATLWTKCKIAAAVTNALALIIIVLILEMVIINL